MRRPSENYVIEGSKYAHWIGLYLGFHLNWVSGPFVHGRLQNLQTSEVTFAHIITPLMSLHSYGCNARAELFPDTNCYHVLCLWFFALVW